MLGRFIINIILIYSPDKETHIAHINHILTKLLEIQASHDDSGFYWIHNKTRGGTHGSRFLLSTSVFPTDYQEAVGFPGVYKFHATCTNQQRALKLCISLTCNNRNGGSWMRCQFITVWTCPHSFMHISCSYNVSKVLEWVLLYRWWNRFGAI